MLTKLAGLLRSCFGEEWHPIRDGCETMLLPSRKLSAYVNALAAAGFVIEQMAEQTDAETLSGAGHDDRSRKARMLPLSFVLQARKPPQDIR